MIKFILIQWVVSNLILFVKGIELKNYVKDFGYKIKKSHYSKSIITQMQLCVPLFGYFLSIASLFIPIERFYAEAIKSNRLEKINQQRDKEV